MMNSNPKERYQIEIVNFDESRLDKVKVMICQLDFDQMEYDKHGRLYFVDNTSKNKNYIRRFLNIASKQQVDLLVFPELTIPSEFVNELVGFSSQNDMYIIGGTHYKKGNQGYLSVCPIVTPIGVFETEKITPAPFEKSSFQDKQDGAISGHLVRLFRGTKIGDFAVIICLDYTDDNLRIDLGKDMLDFLIVSAFNQQSDEFFHSMHTDVQRSSDGLYVIYSNTYSKQLKGEGRSALFAFIDDCFKSEFQNNGCSDLNPKNKIYEFSEDKNFCIFELDITHKKPYRSKNGYTETNVKVIEEDNSQMDDRYRFLKAIGVDEDRYKFIDSYYVKPREYQEMCELLERDNVLVITGDPGIGKTYTAVHFLQEYFHRGFNPVWFYGLAKEDRDVQKEQLLTFEPQDRDVVYIEDPFGRTVFENREELKTIFSNLIQRFRSSKAKLIITSRTEVFKKFEKEIVSADNLESFKKELNVRNPSYDDSELMQIAMRYIESYTNWKHKKQYISIVMRGISQKRLISPLMIYNLVMNNANATNSNLLKEAIKNAKTTDLVSLFADEIKILSHPAKILLYTILLYGRKNVAKLRDMFNRCQMDLFERSPFEGSSFAFELRGQENHRIQRLGIQIPVYRFSHPAYEEALIILTENDATCALIAETCIKTILKEDSHVSVDLFKRYINRYPRFVEHLIQEVILQDFINFSRYDILVLSRKMQLSNLSSFKETAKQLYPIEKLIDDLYLDDNDNIKLFFLRLKTLNRRKNEIENIEVDFKRMFTPERIAKIHPTELLHYCDLAVAIDERFMNMIECNFQKANIIKKFIQLPTENSRKRFNELLSGTAYANVYQDLKDNLPDIFKGERIKSKNYADILLRYLLKKERPKGHVFLDDGAMRAVIRGANIYPIGVEGVCGNFDYGDIVYLSNRRYPDVLSFVEMSSEDINKYKGLRSPEIYELAEQIIPTCISKQKHRRRNRYVPKKRKKNKGKDKNSPL